MEHKIGTRITLKDGREVKVVEGKGCYGCIFFEYGCVKPLILCGGYQCAPFYRTDHKNVIYMEVDGDE